MMELAGKRVTVMGLGNFGGGLGAARWLAAQGADVLVTDAAPPEKLAEAVAMIQPLVSSGAVRTRLGEHNISDFTATDLVVANPAVPTPWDNRFLRAARAAGVPVTTEMRLLTERLPSRERVIGVTGTAGKSTTTAMIAHALRTLGEPVFLGGNIGGSLLPDLASIRPDDWVVLEVSSAMLHWLDANAGYDGAPGWSPHVAVVTNIASNHVDWHGSFEHYAGSKHVITAHQQTGDTLVIGASEAGRAPGTWESPAGVRRVRVETAVEYEARGLSAKLRLPGRHNRQNALVAGEAVARALSAPTATARERDELMKQVLSALSNFGGLAHRLQYAAEIRPLPGASGNAGASAFNDSKSTTPEAAALAVQALAEDPRFGVHRVHLIAGGYDKKIDLGPMVSAGAACAGVYTIGATGRGLADAVNTAGGRGCYCETLEAAVRAAREKLRPGDALLLSPGCASWDQFVNFERRGEEFVRLVRG